MPNWSPTHLRPAPRPRRESRDILATAASIAFVVALFMPESLNTLSNEIGIPALAVVLICAGWWLFDPARGSRPLGRGSSPGQALERVRSSALTAGGGVFLGVPREGMRYSPPQRAVLVLGPPRSGKTSSVIIPTLLGHTGPAVSTSTKPDVAAATAAARRHDGAVWVFDPTGKSAPAEGSQQLRWSPVTGSARWDDAMLMARAMTQTIGGGTTDRSHWANRAQALLAPMLHAAAAHGRDMDAVVGWVMGHQLDEVGALLEFEHCSDLAFNMLLGLSKTEERERSSIFSAAADALQAYQSESALATARDTNFDPAAFAASRDTVYIHAPADAQAAAAPLVCGLLTEIRRATYRAHADGQLTHGRMLFALDEAANIAPLEELPQIASEGGGQGLTLLIALQDLSQARHRWGDQADGFLTLFGSKLVLPGVADTKTLQAISTMLGEYDRQVITNTRARGGLLAAMIAPTHHPLPHATTSASTQRTPKLSPGEIAGIANGRALHLDGVRSEWLTLTPAHQVEPWRTLTTPTA